MKKLLTTVSMFFLLAFFACNSDNADHLSENELRDKIMAVHDEVMPKMGEIHNLGKKLKQLSKTQLADEDGASKTIVSAIEYLEKADDGMMDWMGDFKQPSKLRGNKSHEEIMAYLNGQLKQVNQVKKDINGSIEKAKELLDSYSKAE
ncbi:MAG TPA: hypothetical protein ENJ95_01045 [Bacteroidetes bacterium]|nr:hypothetical protein [Bacteroidota bacterium]